MVTNDSLYGCIDGSQVECLEQAACQADWENFSIIKAYKYCIATPVLVNK